MPDTEWSKEYSDRGIERDTWACVFVGSKVEAKTGVWNLAASGVETKVTKDADGKRWHVAVRGGLAANPIAYVVSIRGEPYEPISCPADHIPGQHPQALRVTG